jgi:hypothetical protein
MTTIIKWLNNPYVLGLLIVAGATVDLILWGFDADLNKSEWASWVQAVGSIAAIFGAFAIAASQDKKTRDAEIRQRVDGQLLARALAVRNMVQVITYALENANVVLTAAVEGDVNKPWQIDPSLARIDHLRNVLDAHITPATDHLAVVSALISSEVLAHIHSFMSVPANRTDRDVDYKCRARLLKGRQSLDKLIRLQHDLDESCRARGLTLNPTDSHP